MCMQDPFKTMLISAAFLGLATCAILAWDFSSIAVASGYRDLIVTINAAANQPVSSIYYTTLDGKLVREAIASYPTSEPSLQKATENPFVVSIPTSSRKSRFGRDLGHTDAFDTILLCIVYENRSPEFIPIAVPDRSEPNSLEVQL